MAQKNFWDIVRMANQEPEAQPMMSTPDPMMLAMLDKNKQASNPMAPPTAPVNTPVEPRVDMGKMNAVSMNIPFGQSEEDKEYEALIKEQIQERAGGIKGMQAQLQDLQNKNYGSRNVNVQTLMALADSMTGGNMAQTYKAPTEKAEDKVMAAKLQDAIEKQKGVITDDMLQLLKQKSSNASMKAWMTQQGREDRYQQSQLLKKEDTIRKDLDKTVDTVNDFEQQIGLLDQALTSGNPAQINSVLSQFARSISGEKGVLTDRDVTRVMPANLYNDIAKFQNYISRDMSAEVPPELTNQMRQLIQNARMVMPDIKNKALDMKRRMYEVSTSYAPLMQRGGSGDQMFQAATGRLKSFENPEPMGDQKTQQTSNNLLSPTDWLKKKRGQ